MSATLYHGFVTHRRHKPVSHRLAYRVFSLLVDLDRLDDLDRAHRLLSRNRFNLFSFFDRDHGDGSPDLAAGTRDMLRARGFSGAGRIRLLCYPRILGYVFNPLSVYYCHDADDQLEAVIYEVRNTFGGKHAYLIPADGAEVIRQQAKKRFHVSPFIDMATTYHFRLSRPGEKLSLTIRETDADGPLLDAVFAGKAEAVSDPALLAAFFRYPLMTLKVIAAIHFEAAKLFAKGMRLRTGITPTEPVTLVTPRPSQDKVTT